ncbi:hypothetical protein GO491_07230 [Flavobacteriaceae bacterium Ap0902]|nr:hypothetical protein [Flavobacteriaceae bacterium Ap0902]
MKIIHYLLVICCSIFAFYLSKNSWDKQEISYDLAQLNHVKYGLFNANEWKIKTTELIYRKLDNSDLINENSEVIESYVSEVLYNLIQELENYVEQEKNRGQIGEQIVKHIVANTIQVDEIILNLQGQIPELSKDIVNTFKNFANDPKVKQKIKNKIDSFIDVDMDVEYSEITTLKNKYNSDSKEDLNVIILEKQINTSKKTHLFGILFILLSILSFIIFLKSEEDRFYLMTIILLLLLFVGISVPMIQIEAKLDMFKFNILGENIIFTNQNLFYQSKSILQVFKILISDGKLFSIITALFIITFSIIFPILKIIASILFRKGHNGTIIHFLCFKSSKWSMADVMVVSILLAYIGLQSLVENQVEAMTRTVNQLEVVATMGSSSLQFGVLVFLCFVILSIFYSSQLQKAKRTSNISNKYF